MCIVDGPLLGVHHISIIPCCNAKICQQSSAIGALYTTLVYHAFDCSLADTVPNQSYQWHAHELDQAGSNKHTHKLTCGSTGPHALNDSVPYRNSPGRCSWASAGEVAANPALHLPADCWSWQSLCRYVDATTCARDQATKRRPLRPGRVGWHGLFVSLGSDFACNDNEQSPDCRLVKWALCSNTCIMTGMQTVAA